ncbi:MAG: ferrous iron transport protein A [Clostridia bacterium]|nr:ferrous iron transport protein A [Clostridia bacterium]
MFRLASLNDLKEGQKCVVTEILIHGAMRRRLMDLGVIEGTEIECAMKSPCGDPAAFYIKGALIALRMEDSSRIIVQSCDSKGEKNYG